MSSWYDALKRKNPGLDWTQTIPCAGEFRQLGGMDCGPTCAAFLRYGGWLAKGAPQEAGAPLSFEGFVFLMEKMRNETGASEKHDGLEAGTDFSEVEEILDEFAAVFGRKRYNWELYKEAYDVGDADFAASRDLFGERLQEKCEASPRGSWR